MKKNIFFKTAIIISLLANGALFNVNAQVTIGSNKAPETFAALELVSNEACGFRLPQMTTLQRIYMEATAEFQAKKSTEAMGLQIFNKSTKCVETWNGAKWIALCAPESEPDFVEINGIKWATSNVDMPGTFAANPEDAGMFYQWNRITGWSSTDPMISSEGGTVWDNSFPTGTTWETANDPCPTGWRVPTMAEFQSLGDADNVWTTVPADGRIFGSGENTIFLPAVNARVGLADGILFIDAGIHLYWSATQLISNTAISVGIGWTSLSFANNPNGNGFAVRCVME